MQDYGEKNVVKCIKMLQDNNITLLWIKNSKMKFSESEAEIKKEFHQNVNSETKANKAISNFQLIFLVCECIWRSIIIIY